jgi:SAM-dependent methyltransferase
LGITSAWMNANPGLRLLGKFHARLVHERRIAVLADHLSGFLKPGWQILDVGCGDGKLDSVLGTLLPELEIQGVEILARADCSIPCESYDGSHLPFANGSFDACLLVDVLHHAIDPLALLMDACRVSRHFVLIKDHLAENVVDHWTLRLMDWIGNRPHGVHIPYRYRSCSEWQELYNRAGVVPITTDLDLPLYPVPFSMIFGRSLHFISLLKKNF